MNPEQPVLDAIDALIDDQLEQGEPVTGYDYDDPDYPRCRCGWTWHGLPRSRCPGTPFEGPLRPYPVTIDDGSPWTLANIMEFRREIRSAWTLPADQFDPSEWIDWDEYQRASQRLAELNPGDPVAFHDGHGRTWHGRVTDNTSPDSQEWTITIGCEGDPIVDAFTQVAEAAARAGESLREFVDALSASETLPEAGSDGRPPVPRPSRTPPMWAHDPTRTRRRRNR